MRTMALPRSRRTHQRSWNQSCRGQRGRLCRAWSSAAPPAGPAASACAARAAGDGRRRRAARPRRRSLGLTRMSTGPANRLMLGTAKRAWKRAASACRPSVVPCPPSMAGASLGRRTLTAASGVRLAVGANTGLVRAAAVQRATTRMCRQSSRGSSRSGVPSHWLHCDGARWRLPSGATPRAFSGQAAGAHIARTNRSPASSCRSFARPPAAGAASTPSSGTASLSRSTALASWWSSTQARGSLQHSWRRRHVRIRGCSTSISACPRRSGASA
mmetsp:Transcript_102033/g.304454  ORF Transcript_102033/g.304454 Transcript_102033/m.304454 type:complete len:273 (+) Transcript_102033:97-915(+)